ncbi:DUF2254 domain-containing protein [Kineococcus sp. SYSU DK018]|uniref:DUF2254 domain-containing protein n=1 Tax=Kineococcus sp. SYSU DK018 TaxID=3383139 RepID=UPI003D7EE228
MRTPVRSRWEELRSQMWFLPGVLVVGGAALAEGLVRVDSAFGDTTGAAGSWLFSGSADAARTLLSAIAGSLLTALSISFSLTMVALQQASSQFSPRILRGFTSSRTTQLVVGAFSGTFIYALMVLRTVRSGEDGPAFVPGLAVTVAVVLAVACIGLLVLFIHRVSQSLQVSVVVSRLRDDLLEELEALHPGRSGDPAGGPGEVPGQVAALREELYDGPHALVRAERGGFVRDLETRVLLSAGEEHDAGRTLTVHVRAGVGSFVARGSVVAAVAPPPAEGTLDEVRRSVVLADERTPHRDPLFVVQQLVDVGLRALSPSTNDPTTAEHVLLHLGDALGTVAGRDLPSPVRLARDGRLRLLVERPDWPEHVDAAFSQLRRAGAEHVSVTLRLLEVLGALGERVPAGRAGPLLTQVRQVLELVPEQQQWTSEDRRQVHERAARLAADLARLEASGER